MAVQLTFRSPAGDRTVTLETTLVVGRDAACDVCIDTVRLSRRHAEFTLTDQGVVVRDLGSRNGVLLNGTRVDDARVTSGARILLGDVAVTVSGARGATTVAAIPPTDVVDATLRKPAPAPTGALPQTPVADADKTTLLPPGVGTAGRGAAAPPPAAIASPAASPDAASSRPRTSRLTFSARLFALSLAVTVVLSLTVAVPLVVIAGQQIAAAAAAHATTLLNQVVIENRAALSAGQNLAVTVRATAAEPGVRGVLILAPDGRVLAPPERLNETVSTLPAFGDIAAISGPEAARVDDQFEAVGVMTVDGRRTAIVWVAYDPGYARGGQSTFPFFLGVDLLVAIAAGIFLALTMRRMIASRLEALALDVELAATGRLGELSARHDLPWLDRPIESLNFLIKRGRSGPDRVTEPSAPQASAVPAYAERAPSGEAARVTLDGAFIVQRVDGGAAAALGADPAALVGRHVLEVTKQQPILDAMIECLSALADAPSASRDVSDTAAGVRRVSVERSGQASGGAVLTFHVGDA
jgi:hypothetical protein